MASDVDIANFSLMKLGHGPIASFIDDSDQARAVNASYNLCRDDILTAIPWNFATSWYALAKFAAIPVDPSFDSAYALPTGHLKVWSLDLQGWAWEVQGNALVTNLTDPIAQVTIRVTDTGLFSAQFAVVLGYRLAAEMADGITARHTTSNDLFALYERKLQDAKNSDGQEGSPLEEDINTLKAVRSISSGI